MKKFIKLKKVKRKRKHGFLSKMQKHSGRKVLSKRRKKGRTRLAV